MAVVVATTPTFPAPGPVKVSVSFSGGGNFGRLWITSAPPGSVFRAALDLSGSLRLEVFNGGVSNNVELGEHENKRGRDDESARDQDRPDEEEEDADDLKDDQLQDGCDWNQRSTSSESRPTRSVPLFG